jgi:symplekin
LEDLPAGHPIITREALESISEYAFSTLRGLTLLGGQVKMDVNLLSDMMLRDNTPSAQVVSILKPAALAFLELESGLPKGDDENALDIHIDRTDLEYDFVLSAKSYALTVNAVSAIATNRPVFFKEGATCLVRRAADPLTYSEDGGGGANNNNNNNLNLPKNAILGIQAQIKASCLTLLRNALSVQSQVSDLLHKCLAEKCDMQIQADKALKMAQQTTALKTAGRAARNRANMFYEWESGDTGRTSKRQRETDDALAKMRAARASRGLGHGIQLPTSMMDSIELILANLQHLPAKRPAATSSSSAKGKTTVPISLDFVVDAINTNGASLAQEEGRWYSRDGGNAWTANPDDGTYELSSKLLAVTTSDADQEPPKKKSKQDSQAIQDQQKMYKSQCQTAAAEAVGRIVANGMTSRNGQLTEMANRVAARLAWTLKNVAPPAQLQPAQDMALDTIESAKKRLGETDESSSETTKSMDQLAASFPLVTSCLVLEATSVLNYGTMEGREAGSLSNAVLNEAYAQDCQYDDEEKKDDETSSKYKASLDVFAGSVLHSSERANSKATDNDRKRVATSLASKMQREFGALPLLTASGLKLVSAMCDIDDIAKKAKEAGQKQSQQSIATSAALHAAKQAAEKRATAALLVLRDAAFQRTNRESRRSAVRTAVALASGHFGASPSCEDKALKLVMNVLYARSDDLADAVVEAAIAELKVASDYAIKNYSKIQKANKEAAEKETANEHAPKGPFAPDSEEEKIAMDKVRKPAVLFMALCIRRPEIIKTLFELSSVPKADALSKAVRQQMSKLARAAGTKHGAADIALKVADVASSNETPLLLALLDNLASLGEKGIPPQEFIDACFEIQEKKKTGDSKDARFLIPIAGVMMREELIKRLPEFVDADDAIFMAAMVKMGERLGRQALLFREEPEPDNPTLKGLTGCEQLVYLHKLDFQAAGLPQKRYLDAIRLCLDSEEIFTDSLVMSALDHMSGVFLTGAEKLPLAFMRTIILVCSKHESLHAWICHTLLPRLVEGKIYEDRRQWEGWMRCAKILESSSGSGVSSAEAINRLPPEQLALYQARYGSS